MPTPVGPDAGHLVPFQRSDIDQSITSRFEKVVSYAASNTAIRNGGRETTYDALNRAANAVAHRLISQWGTIPEPVGLLLDHDERTISAILGVLKAGKFYVPLDPSYPPERLAFIVRHCTSRVIITDQKHRSLAHEMASAACSVMELEELDNDARAENPVTAISPLASAAVFYTSGTTGRPKGVIQTHRLVLHRILLDTDNLRIGPADRFSVLSSPSYSVSLRSVFGALLNGATVCPFDAANQGLTECAAWLARERISIYLSVPAMFRQLIAGNNGAQPVNSVRVVQLTGDAVTADDFELYRRHFSPACQFVVEFGSNETGVIRRYVAGKSTTLPDGVVPLGYQVDDKDVLILDDRGRQLPYNQVGEIAVRSEFLSPGYWRQPDLTGIVFETDPYDATKRIFHSGDLGMFLSDGCLIYKGRKDFRAKIRGIRVEVEEIEEALRSHPSIDESVVIARENESGHARLVAYVVTKPEVLLTVTEIRRFLTKRLPRHMVPSAFVFLDRLPLSSHGKVDRQALPSPDGNRPQIEARYVAARDDLERHLTRTWESITGITPIGVEDNLFDLGVDSLMLLRATVQLEQRLGTHLAPADLFNSPTIALQADMLRVQPASREWSSLVALCSTGSHVPFFWIHGGYRSIFLSHYLGPDQPFYLLEHEGQDGTPVRHTEVETIAACYLREIRSVRPTGPYLLGGYSFGGIIALELAHILTRDGEQVPLLVLLDPPSLLGRDAPRPSPQKTSSGSRRLVATFRRHAQNLSQLSIRGRLAYVGERAIGKITNVLPLRAISRLSRVATYRACLALHLRLPIFVRRQYMLDIFERARRGYVPRPYAGPVILFKGHDRHYRSHSDWEQLLGRHEVHLVDADHLQMPGEAFIHLWAPTLKSALLKAQVKTPQAEHVAS